MVTAERMPSLFLILSSQARFETGVGLANKY